MRLDKNKILFMFIGLAFTALCGLLLKECQQNAELRQDSQSMESFYENEKNQMISRDSIHAQQIVDTRQNLMSEISAREILEKEFERFKEIQSHVRFESYTRIETLRVAYNDPNINILADYTDYIPVDSVKKYFIQVPRDLVHNEQWFNFAGTVDKEHFMIDSLSFINKFDVTIGKKKSDKSFSFLRKKEYTVELVSYNPYTSIPYINNIVVDNQKKDFRLPIAFGAGAASMFLITKLIQ